MALQMVMSKREKDNVYLGPYNCVLWMREVLLGRALEMQMLIDMHLRLSDPKSDEQLAEFWYEVERDTIRFTVGSDKLEHEANPMMVHIKLKQVAKERWSRMEEILAAQVGVATWTLFENLTGAMCKPTITEEQQQILDGELFANMTHMGAMLLLARMKMIGLNGDRKELMLPGEIVRNEPSVINGMLEDAGIKLVSCVIVDENAMEELSWS